MTDRKPDYRTRLFKKLSQSEVVGLDVLALAIATAKKAAVVSNDYDAGLELREIEKLMEASKGQAEE